MDGRIVAMHQGKPFNSTSSDTVAALFQAACADDDSERTHDGETTSTRVRGLKFIVFVSTVLAVILHLSEDGHLQ